jgi:hypothetical protein
MKRNIKAAIVVLGVVFISQASGSQAAVKAELLKAQWKAQWICYPGESGKDYGVYHFRRTFKLDSVPEKFIVNVSADNRYRLFVNGKAVCFGPARSDLEHWCFETVDIAPYLQKGANVIAAVVWNFADLRPFAQFTLRTAFVLCADKPEYNFVNTGPEWKVFKNSAYEPIPVDNKLLQTFIIVGPTDKVDGAKYPWGWEKTEFDDAYWQSASVLENAKPRGLDLDATWMLVPRTIPFMEQTIQRIGKVRKAQGIEIGGNFFDGKNKLAVPANTKATILFDQTLLTTGYPELTVTGGKGSEVRLTYAEAMFDPNGQKGNRNEIEGRRMLGYYDIFLPDGGASRMFRPLWFRTWRYLQMDVQTADEPLTIDDFYGVFAAYPFKENAYFKSSDASIAKIWEAGWRTAWLCANETYYDCPYYEQMQYVGDTRIQALVSLYISGDDRLMRKAITDFDNSRIPDGLTQSRYPSVRMQIIPPYSLFWVVMVHDYWMHRDDPAFVKSFLHGIDGVLLWHEKQIGENGMLGPTPWWNFVDWSWRWDNDKGIGGIPPGGDKEGRSSILNLQLAYVLGLAAELNDGFGRKEQAEHYRQVAESLKKVTKAACWDSGRRLLADTPDKNSFSQHANLLAVLVDLISKNEQKKFMQRVAEDTSLLQCTFYYRYYLLRAMKKAGLADRYIEMLTPWRDMIANGLTTFAENPDPTRSDCHAWSASPNYDLLATVCGIEPGEPGFKSVRIEPHLGPLTWVEGKVPHPAGDVTVRLQRKENGGIKGEITLPEKLTGTFVWKTKIVLLKPGSRTIDF